jgi:hypothetical protein
MRHREIVHQLIERNRLNPRNLFPNHSAIAQTGCRLRAIDIEHDKSCGNAGCGRAPLVQRTLDKARIHERRADVRQDFRTRHTRRVQGNRLLCRARAFCHNRALAFEVLQREIRPRPPLAVILESNLAPEILQTRGLGREHQAETMRVLFDALASRLCLDPKLVQ